MKSIHFVCIFCLTLLFFPVTLPAADQDDEDIKAFEKMFPPDKPSEEDFYRADQMLITATKRQMFLHDAPAIATIITAEEISNMGASNLMDVLKMVPGIGISRNEQGFFMFDVRGISTVNSEKILLLIDGHSLNKTYVESGLKFLTDYLSVNNIQQIEIIRGPASALYGTNAFVAVINIITKRGVDLEGVEVAYSYGSFNTHKVNLLGGKNYDNGLQVVAGLDYWQTDGADLRIERDRFSRTPISNAPDDADTSFEAVEMLLKLSYADLSYEGHFLQNKRGVYIGFANALTDYDNTLEYENFWHEIRYKLIDQETLVSTVKLYWDQFEQDASVAVMPSGFNGSYPDGMIGGPKAKDRTIGGEMQFDYDILENNHLLFGFVYEKMKQYDVRSISNFNPTTLQYLGSIQDISSWANWNKNVNREIFAGYLQDEWQLTKTVNLTAGLRYDHYSDFGDTTNPRLGLVWNFWENAEFKLLYGQAFRAPSFSELYNDNNPSLMGNADLEPEKITTYEAAVGYRLNKFINFDLNYFYNDIDDMIIRDNTSLPARYDNLGGAEIEGLEFVLTGNYRADDYWKLCYSYQDPKDADTGERLPFVPNQRASFSISYGLSQYLVSHMDILWTSNRPRPEGDTRDDIDSYTTVDIALTVRDFWKNLEIRGVIKNLFNETYSDPDLSGAAQFIPDDYPREGISYLVTISYKF